MSRCLCGGVDLHDRSCPAHPHNGPAQRRARVLLALTDEQQTLFDLSAQTGLPWMDIASILRGLMHSGLAYPGTTVPSAALTTAPHVPTALAEARAALEAP